MIEQAKLYTDSEATYECFSCGESINNGYDSGQCATCLGED